LRHGLTFIEVIVVLGIVGSVATAVTIGLGQEDRANEEATRTHLRELASVVEDFETSQGRLPRHFGELIDGNFIETSDTLDPWGRAYRYRLAAASTNEYTICSRGDDGNFSTTDDVCTDSD
jgi:prepilin-type N-terminal cleavage/methylation domain-containing protein